MIQSTLTHFGGRINVALTEKGPIQYKHLVQVKTALEDHTEINTASMT